MSDKPSKTPTSPMTGTIFANYSDRYGLYLGIACARSAGLRDRLGRAIPRSTILMREVHAILQADRKFLESARQAVLAEREAIATSFEQAGQSDLAALVRQRPAIEDWQKP